MTGMTQEIQDALFNIDEVDELRHAIYNDEDDDYESDEWHDKKRTAIDETCVAMDLEDIKKILVQ